MSGYTPPATTGSTLNDLMGMWRVPQAPQQTPQAPAPMPGLTQPAVPVQWPQAPAAVNPQPYGQQPVQSPAPYGAAPQQPAPVPAPQLPSPIAPYQQQPPQYTQFGGVALPPGPLAPAGGVTTVPNYQPSAPAGQGQVPGGFQSSPGASRNLINQYVRQGRLDPRDAAEFRSDQEFLDELFAIATEGGMTGPQPGQTGQGAPVVPTGTAPAGTPQAPAPPLEDQIRSIWQLQQAGMVTQEGGRFVTQHPELQPILDRVNAEQARAQSNLFELRDPAGFLKKYGSEVLTEAVKPLHQEIERLRNEVQRSLPKPYEGWMQQNGQFLKVMGPDGNPVLQPDGRPVLTLAGSIYDATWSQLQSMGVTNERHLHDLASRAAEPALQQMRQASPAGGRPVVQQAPTFLEAAAQYGSPAQPGFNAPGSQMTAQQPTQYTLPTTNQGQVDFLALSQGIRNGSIPRLQS